MHTLTHIYARTHTHLHKCTNTLLKCARTRTRTRTRRHTHTPTHTHTLSHELLSGLIMAEVSVIRTFTGSLTAGGRMMSGRQERRGEERGGEGPSTSVWR